MALSLSSLVRVPSLSPPFFYVQRPTTVTSTSAVAERMGRRRGKQPRLEDPSSSSTVEKGMRFTFMEELMDHARRRDSAGVAGIIYDMIAAGLSPGPRSFHGLIVSQTLNCDVEGAMQSLRRELSSGLRPLHETFVAMVRLFGSQGLATRGLELLLAMEKLNFDIRNAWLVLAEELVKNLYLDDANAVFLKGANGGLRATDELYDLLIEENCKAGDHSNALTIAYEMEAAGRMATTFHFNCLLSVQATCGIPEISFATFENMEYGGEDYMKPDTESYNWVIQAYTRAESYDRVQDVVELLGMMVEDHRRLQPNVKTYAFATSYLTLQSMMDVRQPLEAMFTSTQWLSCAWAKKAEGKEIRKLILNDKFWATVTYAILSTRPLVQVLRLVDAEKKPAMGFIYNAMDEAKEMIAHNLGGEEASYREIWDIIDARLLVECFTKYCVVREAIRHFRALKNFLGGTKVLYNEGNHGDPLSLYLRALCREGRIVELLEALEAMSNDNQPIPPRAMILSRKYRTLVSSWIEPLQEEADLGFEIDYVERYIAEGGLTGERKRWVPRRGKTPLDPDAFGFAYSNPMENSFKQRCLEESKIYHRKLLKTLKNEGPTALGEVSDTDYLRVVDRLRKIIKGPERNILKPKAASKMIVSELKEELEAQGLPIDGTRQVLYQRVQKARRINRSRGRPLWVPPAEQEEEEVDEDLEELVSRIKLQDGNTEFWKHRFLGEGLKEVHDEEDEGDEDVEIDDADEEGDGDVMEDTTKEAEDDEIDEEEDEVEQTVAQVEDATKVKKVKKFQPPQMLGVQLLKDSEETATTTKQSRRKLGRMLVENDDDDDWFPEDLHEAFKEMRERKIFDVSDMYTIADAWGWTWEKEQKSREPPKWSQEWEVDLGIKIMKKVIELGGKPTIGDCAMILRAALRAPLPSAFLTILQETHKLGFVFGSPLYDEIILLCLDLGEVDAAIAIVADMETTGVKVPDQTLDKVLSARPATGSSTDEPTVVQ